MPQKLITLLMVCFFAPLSLLSQTWDRDIYMSQECFNVTSCDFKSGQGGLLTIDTRDSGWMFCSDVFFTRINKYGDTLWAKKNMLDTLSMHAYPQKTALLSDGGYIIASPACYFGNPASYAAGLFARIDSNGNILFSKTTPAEREWGRGLSVAATADNGFYISYTYDSTYFTSGGTGSRIVVFNYIERYDSSNSCVWRKKWETDYCMVDPYVLNCSDAYWDDLPHNNVHLAGAADGVIFARMTTVGRLNADGTTQFETDISGFLPLFSGQYGLFSTSDGGAIAILYDTTEHICKFNSAGAFIHYDSIPHHREFSGGCELTNGRYLIPGIRDNLGHWVSGIYLFDSSLALIDSIITPFRDTFLTPDMIANQYGGAFTAFAANVGGTLHVIAVNFDSLYNIHRHLKVSLFSNCLVPGDTSKLTVSLHNYGNRNVDTVIRVIKDPHTYYVSSSIPPLSISGDTIVYWIDSLLPDSTRNILTRVRVDSTLGIGVMLSFHAWSPYPNNLAIPDDSATYYGTTVGSLDPNFKMVNKPYYCTPDNREFVYVIGFENTGNYYARNIKVEDTIDEHLDISTLEILSGDPQVPQVELSGGNKVRFMFTDINLPDSMTSPGNHHGEFAYSVKLRSNATVGNMIRNTAHIYFDYNAAVVTNTTTNIISDKNASLYGTFDEGHVKVIPNPTSGSFTVLLPEANTKYSILITDVTGRVYSSGMYNTNVVNYRLNLPNGIYMVAAYNYRTRNKYTEKVVIYK